MAEKKKKSIFDTLTEKASQVYDQVNPLDNGLTYSQRTPTTTKSGISQLGQFGGQIARALGGNTARFVNTANLGARQIANTGRMTVAQLTGNADAFRNANTASQQDYNRFTTQGGVLNTGTFFQSPEEAASGDLSTVARRIGGGTVGTAAEVLPFARGATLARPGTRLLNRAARGAAEGALYGAGGGLANELIQGQGTPNIRNIIQSAATGAVMGAGGAAAARGAQNRVPLDERGAIGKAPKEAPVPKSETIATADTPRTRTRGFTQNVRTSPEISAPTQAKVQGEYQQRSTADLAASSEAFAKKGMKGIQKDVRERLEVPTGQIDDRTVSDAIAVAKRLDGNGKYDEASDILDKLAEHGTKLGQSVQAFSLLSNRTPDGILFKAERDLKKAGVKLTDDMRKELRTLKEAIRKTTAGTEERQMAVHRMVEYVTSQTPTPFLNRATNVWRAGLLTSPITTAGNVLANSSQAAVRNAFVNPISAAADILFSAFTGKRTKTLTTRGQAQGVKEGIRRGGTYLKTGFDVRNPNEKFDVHRTNYGNGPLGKIFGGYTNAVYRWMGAQDQPFYYAAKQQSLYDQALAAAKNEGLSGKQADAFVNNFVKNPPRRVAQRAEKDAEFSVFGNDTAIASGIQGLRQRVSQYEQTHPGSGGAWTAAIDFLIPFTRVPAAVTMRVIDNTPVGVLREVSRQIATKKFDQRALSEAVGNGMVGPALIAVGAGLAKAGDITLGWPSDPNEQELWKMEGKQPYSIRIGDQWLSMNYIQPFGTLIAMGAAYDNARKETGFVGAASQTLGTTGQALLNQSFLKGLSGTLNAVNDPQRYAESLAENTAGSVTPNIIRTVARATDPLQREINSPADAIKSGLPGLRNDLDPALDAFGRPLEARTSGANQALNPLRPSDVRSGDSVVDELRRLQGADEGVMPSRIKTNALGGDTKLNDKQLNDLKQKVGPEIYENWKTIMADGRYIAADDAGKAEMLRSASNQIGEARKLEYGIDQGVLGSDALKDKDGEDKLNKKQVELLKGNIVDFLAETKNINMTPAERYQDALDQFNENKGAMSQSDIFKAENNLARLKVGVDFDDDTLNVYGLGRDKIADYLEKNPDGAQELIGKLYQYDQALIAAGIIDESKFEKWEPGTRAAAKGSGKGNGKISISAPSLGTAKSAPSSKITVTGGRKVAVKARRRGKSSTLKIKRG